MPASTETSGQRRPALIRAVFIASSASSLSLVTVNSNIILIVHVFALI